MQRLKQSLVSKDLCDYAEFLTKEPAFCEEMRVCEDTSVNTDLL